MYDVLICAVIFGTFLMIVRSAMDQVYRLRLLAKCETVDPALIKASTSLYSHNQSLKWGMVLVAVGIVILLVEYGGITLRDDAILGLIAIAAGAAMLLHHLILDWRTKQMKSTGAA